MSTRLIYPFNAVYGPVNSWRYGRSLGIDPIGFISTCSFNCVYCQLGEIERKRRERSLYVSTQQILEELRDFAPWDNVDAIALSGSGEPTLALNLGEILTGIHELTGQPTVVLTNGTLLRDPEVRAALACADKVSVKLDAISPDGLRRINQPVTGIKLADIWLGLKQFRVEFRGELGIQTMILGHWDAPTQAEYIRLMRAIAPSEIQLNVPSRPKPVNRQLDGRENHNTTATRSYPTQKLKCVSTDTMQAFAQKIHDATGIPVRYARHSSPN